MTGSRSVYAACEAFPDDGAVVHTWREEDDLELVAIALDVDPNQGELFTPHQGDPA